MAISGHDHSFVRAFHVDGRAGRPDHTGGIRLFVVGTGGAHLYSFMDIKPNSEVRLAESGVMKLSLRPDGYTWEFVGEAGVRDSGNELCR